jgi:type II secretory pathway component PulC
MKNLVIFLLFAVSLRGADNTYSNITKRNAFELTGEKPIAILPPVREILAPSIFLTGITRWKGTNKVHLVLRKAGESDKFVSLRINEKQYNVELKKVLEDSVLIEANGSNKLLSFKTNGLPTIVTKAPAAKKTSQSGQRQIKSDIDQNERRRQYDEYRSRQK